ncbi:ribosomal protein S5 domain 2-type protein [Gigaspora rosea]|uniref:Mevalonate kinase n=1 Tax=Gigaspora rosea TaxID=44941 RepID=A0A397UXD5_9GLOM|nr:ribosomal protein S5 domain 2-type protein [Gigaspora rosea]
MSLDRYIISAPGKVILFGEHAVVHGKTAIAGSLDGLRTYALFEKRIDEYLELNLPDLGLQQAFLWPTSVLPYNLVNNIETKDGPQNLQFNDILLQKIKSIVSNGQDNQEINNIQQIAAFTFLYLYTCLKNNSQTSWNGMTICVRSNLPIGSGLGSSASYSVCLATGLLLAFGYISSPYENNEKQEIKKMSELINLWAYQAEKVIHGTPSGVDNSVATYGGVIVFTNGVIQNIRGTQSLRFLLTNTKVPRHTKTLVENVRTRLENFPKIVNLILDAIHGISESFKEILEKEINDDQELCTKIEGFIDMGHHLLNSLGVGHPSLDKVREIAAQYDLHTKLTGAGGGGCAITLIRNGNFFLKKKIHYNTNNTIQ